MSTENQTALFTEEELINLQELSSNNLGNRTSSTSGRKCSEKFDRLKKPSLWAKKFVTTIISQGDWFSDKCVLSWKLKGTKDRRYYCQIVPLVRHIEEAEFGLLLKTPCAADAYTENLSKKETKFGNSGTLAQEIVSGFVENRMKGLLPTPQAQEGEKITGLENQDSMTKRVREMTGKTSQLNPRFVAEMMGFLPNWTELPFLNNEKKA